MWRIRRSYLLAGLGLIIAGLAVFAAYRQWFATPVPVLTQERVTRSDIEASVRASGQIRPVKEVEVGTLANGQLKALRVKLGERVVQGQLLAEIDPALAENEVKRTQALLDEELARRRSAVIQLDLLATQRVRAQVLREQDAGSQQALDQVDADWRRQRAVLLERDATLLRTKILLDDARTLLSRTRITAPIDGEVTAIKILEGQTVVATQTAQVILVLSDLTKMTVATQVSEADITRVALGQTAHFSVLAEPEHRQSGTIREIEPSPVKKTGDTSRAIYYQALFDVSNQDQRLRPLMTADVTIVAQHAEQVLTVPLTALIKGGHTAPQDALWLLGRGGKPARQSVTLGMRSDTRIVVISGLKEGDMILSDAMTYQGESLPDRPDVPASSSSV